MPEPRDELTRTETGDVTKFSLLEASLVKTEVEQRPNLREMNNVYRHAETADLAVDALDLEFGLDAGHYPLANLRSLQQVFDAVQGHQHLGKEEKFSRETSLECLDVGVHGGGKQVECFHSLQFLWGIGLPG